MMRALFVTMDGGGNLPPMLGIARELQRRGGAVTVLGHPIQCNAIERAGLSFLGMSEGRDYDSSAPRSTLRALRDLTALFADRGIGRDAVAAARAMHADVVVVDCLLWGAALEVAASGVPLVSLVHSQWEFFRANARGPVGLLARAQGSNAVAAQNLARDTLVATRAEFEVNPGRAARAGAEHVGFVLQDAPVAAVERPHRPRVLVSFSTTSFPGQARALQAVIDALEAADVEVTVTTGAVDRDDLRVPQGMRVESRIDHGTLLPTTSLVVGHGGHATTARALSHGIPVLVLPMHPLMDQPAIGAAVERLGVGRTMSKTSSPARIRETVMAMLVDDRMRAAAGEMGRAAREIDGAVTAVDLLEQRYSATHAGA